MQLVASHVGTSTSCTWPSATYAACNHLGTHRRIITRSKFICNSLAHSDLSPAADHLQQAALALAAAGVAGPALIEAAYNELRPRKCKECLGTGFLICSSCQGRGKVGLKLPGDASPISTCNQCQRRGRCRCSKCDATGLENNWLWQPASDPGWGPRGS